MYTKCVLTVHLNLKKRIGVIGGTMYTKCVLTVPFTIVDPDFT